MDKIKTLKGTGSVSSGHSLTTSSAIQVLEAGGNAYDAILAAYMTAVVVEPALTSLGGGGYLLAHTAKGEDVLYDFFVQTPSLKEVNGPLDFFPVTVDFGTTTQAFHVGHASVAVPGGVEGVMQIHKDLGVLPFDKIIKPAQKYAREGTPVTKFQAHVMDILWPIFDSTKGSRDLYSGEGNKTSPKEGEYLKNPDYADFLDRLAKEGSDFFYTGDIARQIVSDMKARGGYITLDDLAGYKVVKRKPVHTKYRGAELITNTPPSAGGVLIAFTLSLCEKMKIHRLSYGSPEYLTVLAKIMKITNVARADNLDGALLKDDISNTFLDSTFVDLYKNEVDGITNHMGSTTHISVIDSVGNCASMTTSNGEGSGYVIPGVGIHMNNMLGEEDLHPKGFNNWSENERISSMMSPSVLIEKSGRKIALGTGGSNRIRTALLQVIVNIVDRNMSIKEAVDASRIHFEQGILDVEPGFSPDVLSTLRNNFEKINTHKHKGIFFGGVHCAIFDSSSDTFSGYGDERRSGKSKLANVESNI